MKKIVVASKNPVKIQSTLSGFRKMFSYEEFEITGVNPHLAISNQPKTDKETLDGALLRANAIMNSSTDSDFWVGIEGGVHETEGEFSSFAWVVIRSREYFGKSRTSTFVLPDAVAELIRKGYELGDADDIVFHRENSKQDNGAVGIMTGNVINRASFYEQAVILALVPFKNPTLYLGKNNV